MKPISGKPKPPYRVPLMSEVMASKVTQWKVASTFSGGGGSCTGYRMAGFRVVWANEFIPAAQETYRANHPDTILDCRDIKDVRPEEILAATGLAVGELDVLDGSPPCFPAGTPVTTERGPVRIEDVQVGDRVLTHAGRFMPVLGAMVHKHRGEMVVLSFKYGRKPIKATPEHPFMVCVRRPGREKAYGVPEFLPASRVSPGDLVLEPFTYDTTARLGVPNIVTKERGATFGQSGRDRFEMKLTEKPCPIHWTRPDMAWLLGFYMAEGHRRGRNPTLSENKSWRRGVIYSVADKEVAGLQRRLAASGLKSCATKSRGGASRVTVTSIGFWCLCGVMGDGAANKFVPEAFHAAKSEWQAQFLEGYYSGDGCFKASNRVDSLSRHATTVSRALADGVARMTARVHGVVTQVKRTHSAGQCVIEGRTVNVKDTYSVGYTVPRNGGRSRPGFVDADGAWLPVTGIERGQGPELDVFNIEVAEDNSYVAGGFAVHNCQSFSTAGQRDKGWGKGKTYENGVTQCNENLFFEYVRLLAGLQPKVFIAENVKGLTIGKAKAQFMGDAQLDMIDSQDETILHRLMDAGYVVRWRVLDAADLGVPQTRNRVIFVGVRRDLAARFGVAPCFPAPLGRRYTVRDALPELMGRIAVGNERFEPVFGGTDTQSPTIMAGGARTSGLVEDFKVVHKCGGFSTTDATDNQMPAVTATQCHITVESKIIQQQGGWFEKREVDAGEPCTTVCATQASQFVLESPKVIHDTGGQFSAGDVSDKPSLAVLAQRTDMFVEGRRDPETGASLELDASRGAVCDGTQEFGSAGEAADPDSPSPPVLTPSNSVVYRPERRKFTIAELRRICAFPDDYVLTGSYAQQWARCGNSVPPLMMRAIAESVRDGILAKMEPAAWSDPPKAAPKPPVQAEIPEGPVAAKPKPKAAKAKAQAAEAPKKAGGMDAKWVDYWSKR